MTNIVLIAVALALDAFGVALGIGCGAEMKEKEKVGIILSFGFFQFLFAFLGAGLGNYIDQYIFSITGYISGGIVLLIGLLLLREGYKNDEACRYKNIRFWTYIVLGISVSIDALGIGFSVLYYLDAAVIMTNTVVIGVITAVLTWFSFMIVDYIKNLIIVEKYADYIGGIVLVLFGLNMIL
ncbi:MAG: manganese efflux pump MntP family protein [Bacillota bacterium]